MWSLNSGRRLRCRLGLSLAIALLGLVLGAASVGAATQTKAAKSTLVVLEEETAPSLDLDGPNAAQPQTQEVIDNLMDPLVTYSAKLQGKILIPNYNVTQTQFSPRLASSYTKAGKSFTFHLRTDVVSCAGNPLTADDVVYTFARAKSVSGAAPVGWFLSNTGGIFDLTPLTSKDPADKLLKGEVVKIDDHTVKITQVNPSDLFPRVATIFALDIFDAVEMKKHATAADPWSHQYTLKENTPGFGAYCLKSWTKGSETVLQANPKYYLGQPQFQTITIRKVQSLSSRIAALTSGSADAMYPVTPESLATINSSKNAEVLSWYDNQTLSIGMNYKIAPWSLPKNELLRQAFAYAVPYDEIIALDYKGAARRWYGLFPSAFYGYLPIKKYDTNLAKAKALLAQAGYPGGKGLEKYKGALTVYYAAERSNVIEPVLNRVRTSLARIGVNITLGPITSTEMNTRELVKGDLPMWVRDQLTPIGTDVGFAVGAAFATPAGGGVAVAGNYTGVNPENLQQQKLSGAARLALLHRIQVKMMKELPAVPILEYPTTLAVRRGLTNMEGRPSNTVTYFWLKCPTC